MKARALGFQELYAHAQHISSVTAYPLFWATFCVVTTLVRWTLV